MHNFSFSKAEKLKSKSHIDHLFSKGKSITGYPLRLVYVETTFKDNSVIKTGVSVSKRLHKIAVHRNKIKRLMREAYRLNKPQHFNKTDTTYAIMILYLSRDKPSLKYLSKKMGLLLKQFNTAISLQ